MRNSTKELKNKWPMLELEVKKELVSHAVEARQENTSKETLADNEGLHPLVYSNRQSLYTERKKTKNKNYATPPRRERNSDRSLESSLEIVESNCGAAMSVDAVTPEKCRNSAWPSCVEKRQMSGQKRSDVSQMALPLHKSISLTAKKSKVNRRVYLQSVQEQTEAKALNDKLEKSSLKFKSKLRLLDE